MLKDLKNKFGSLIDLILGLGGGSKTDPQLKQMVLNGGTLIDVRTQREFDGGSAIGAVNIPLSQVYSRIGELKNKKSIIVFCRSGNRSGNALKILENNGFSNVINGGTWKTIRKIQEKNEN